MSIDTYLDPASHQLVTTISCGVVSTTGMGMDNVYIAKRDVHFSDTDHVTWDRHENQRTFTQVIAMNHKTPTGTLPSESEKIQRSPINESNATQRFQVVSDIEIDSNRSIDESHRRYNGK